MLPLDICEAIVKILANEERPNDVRQLSLVAKVFVSMCQKRLFRRVDLVHWQERHWMLPFHPIETFYRHLTAHPHLSSCIRVLEIGCMMNFTFGFSDRYSESKRSWEHTSEEIKRHVKGFVQRNPITILSLFGIHGLPLHFVQSCGRLKDLSLRHISPGESSSDVLPIIELNRLELLEGTMEFFQVAIISAMKLSGLTTLNIESRSENRRFYPHGHRYDDLIHQLLGIPDNLQVLKIWMERSFDEWTCQGNILSRLSASSSKSLRNLRLSIWADVDTPCFPPFGGLIHELEKFSGQNALESIELVISLSEDTPLEITLEECQELDNIVAKGYHHLRKFTLEYEKVVVGEGSAFDDHEATRIDTELAAMFFEGFPWCSTHLDAFVVHGYGYAI
ncbi:hypothetical protein BKA70DRAFT_187077 [Coprinopsis sp. MPI-PUGE-AT-0042]|nr:hypothetical protein BKA70DRAFT_187077 [Coprinopsis sp. MPI-PUGE-AT-0042]